MLKTKRSTRGQRMNELVGDAIDEDNAFYGAEIWEDGDESDNASFSSEEEKPDEFDSDFNDTEDEGETTAEGDDTKKGRRMARDIEKADRAAAKNVYKEPTRMPKRKAAPGQRDTRAVQITQEGPVDRAVRGSTKAKTELGAKERSIAENERKKAYKPRPVIKHTFTQKELLLDGLETEDLNKKWLSQQKFISDEKSKIEKILHNTVSGSLKRWRSKRGMNNVISWTEVDAIPDILKGERQAPPVPEKKCIVSGKVAKYRDPVTGQPYADLEAFQELRRRHKAGLPLDGSAPKIRKRKVEGPGADGVDKEKVVVVRVPQVSDPTVYAKPYLSTARGTTPRQKDVASSSSSSADIGVFAFPTPTSSGPVEPPASTPGDSLA